VNPAPILHVEDSEDDQFFLRRAFTAVGIKNAIHVVDDGAKAIGFLSGTGPYEDREKHPSPCLAILDLKLPQVHGLEVLKWIRQHQKFKPLVVIVLSSSPLRNDVDTAYDLGANSFLVKPLTGEHMIEIARSIKEYWLERNEFPSVSGVYQSPDKLGPKPPRPFNV
jgi:CheY-like chemotaxis protein